MGELLTFMVWRGAIEYARKLPRKADPGHYDEVWSHIWRIQWENKYPLLRGK